MAPDMLVIDFDKTVVYFILICFLKLIIELKALTAFFNCRRTNWCFSRENEGLWNESSLHDAYDESVCFSKSWSFIYFC